MLKSGTRHGFSVIKIKHSIASGGLRPPDPLLQRSTSIFRPLFCKILDPPLHYSKIKFQGIIYFMGGVIILRNGTECSVALLYGMEQLFNTSLHANSSCLGLWSDICNY